MKVDFFHEKPVKALIAIRENEPITVSEVETRAETTYGHVSKIIIEFENMGLVDKEKEGRKKFVSLTGKGEKLAENLSDTWKVKRTILEDGLDEADCSKCGDFK